MNENSARTHTKEEEEKRKPCSHRSTMSGAEAPPHGKRLRQRMLDSIWSKGEDMPEATADPKVTLKFLEDHSLQVPGSFRIERESNNQQSTMLRYQSQLILTSHGNISHPWQSLVPTFLDDLQVSNLDS